MKPSQCPVHWGLTAFWWWWYLKSPYFFLFSWKAAFPWRPCVAPLCGRPGGPGSAAVSLGRSRGGAAVGVRCVCPAQVPCGRLHPNHEARSCVCARASPSCCPCCHQTVTATRGLFCTAAVSSEGGTTSHPQCPGVCDLPALRFQHVSESSGEPGETLVSQPCPKIGTKLDRTLTQTDVLKHIRHYRCPHRSTVSPSRVSVT